MGVHGLWPLLEPVGRRVNIEALTNKKLAVGARSVLARAPNLVFLMLHCDLFSTDDQKLGEYIRSDIDRNESIYQNYNLHWLLVSCTALL